ncbi:MAG: RNA methyltransferase [Clostridia bacterium]|nr:RNA methyltransferase [Clostridia bacterium]
MQLTSRDNPRIKELHKLLSDARARKKSGCFVIEGARLCEDAVRSGIEVVSAYVTESAASRYATAWSAVSQAAAHSFTVSEELGSSLSDTDTPQGLSCVCRMPSPSIATEESGVWLALEDVQDPGNLGTIFRTAEALGVTGVLLSKGCCDLYNPKVLRASMGGVFRLPWLVREDFSGTLRAWGASRPVLAAVVDASALPIMQAPKSGAVIVIGNEGNGLSEEAVAASTHRVTIPMAGRAESLNASMAAGILLWELCREGGRSDA